MLVWVGNRIIVRKGAPGRFWCYECRAEQDYTRSDTHEYFCFMSMPLFSHGIVASAIHCPECGKDFSGEALRGMTDEQLMRARVLAGNCLKGKSVEYVAELLKDWRIPAKQIQRVLGLAVGDKVRKCPSCGLSFKTDKEKCPDCGKVLAAPEPYGTSLWDMSSVVTWTQKPQR
jgi:rRNA maturation protein Nop10